ncbi:disabled homolog 1-like isoform X2 [Watersipora subatra]|uniref:disabled homolog 1-like isoform X2 n=1 Tax=Watersipora subatra TaxID=2589382 RepID=UPI00355C0B88
MSDHKVLAEDTDDSQTATTTQTVKPASVISTGTTPDRFAGNGVLFKGKLFGTAEVNEARGDNVCNTAIGLLKTAVKSTGEHKQKIFLRINYSGITLLDAANQLKLYEHSVNKISFISKDPNDNRAFGYIVSEKDGKKTYFGIKTEKAADAVVVALRDMFQAVFDLKKKEAEVKGEVVTKPADGAAPVEKKTEEQPTAVTTPTSPTEPKLGDEADVKSQTPAVQRENSSSNLLDILNDLSFVEPSNPAPTQAWPQQNAGSWGNAVPAQNDPFAVQPQQNLSAQPTQGQGQSVQFNQSTAPQFNAQSPFPQQFGQVQPQQAAMFGGQPMPMFNPAMPQQMYGMQAQQAVYQQPGMFQQQGATQSPFAQPVANQFANDPFATGVVRPVAPQQTAPTQSASNPFTSPSPAFGVLQPQPAVQQAQAAPAGIGGQPKNLFSDLNPLPSSNQQVGKEHFFSDVKNPPKPKMIDLQPKPAAQPEPVTNNNVLW